MAPIASSSPKPDADDIPIEEIVFSCTICQATVSEVYATSESNQGFYSGSGDENVVVTKMWIAECSHITCAKHLENGAAPFHPKGLPPRAPCPKCMGDKGDDSPKKLYGIRGLDEGEYDSMIPSEWRQCPAIKLDSSIPGIAAVRFQYMALCHYARQARKHWKTALSKQSEIKNAYSTERQQCRQLQTELQELQKHSKVLEEAQVRLKQWEERKPVINHYLGVVREMSHDNTNMRRLLLQFGVEMPEKPYAFEHNVSAATNVLPSRHDLRQPYVADVEVNEGPGPGQSEHASSSSTRKRKRDEDVAHYASQYQESLPRRSSRDLMPPPLPPASRTENSYRQAAIPARDHEAPQQPRREQYVHQNTSANPAYDRANYQPPQIRHESSDIYGIQRPGDRQPNLPFKVPSRNPQPRDYHRDVIAQDEAQDEVGDRLASMDIDHSRTEARHSHIQQPASAHAQHISRGQGHQQPSQWEADRRRPLQPLSQAYNNQRLAPLYENRRSLTTPHRQSTQQEAQASVISPFFKRDEISSRALPAARPETRDRPTKHPNQSQAQYETADHFAKPTYEMHDPHQRRTLNGLSFIDLPRQQTSHRPVYQSPARRAEPSQPYHTYGEMPQTPRNSQGLLQRPDRRPAASPYATARPQSSSYRGRVSLPPNSASRLPAASHEEEMLSQVPGVRGLISQQGHPSYSRPSYGYEPPRALFSSAGGRRSVRR